MSQTTTPLHGVRVLSYGGKWAGRLASLLLADQGAEVIELSHPESTETPEARLLMRGKMEARLDLKDAAARNKVLGLAETADIVIDNLGLGRARKFGIGYRDVSGANGEVVYVALPGFGDGDPMADLPAWEGTISASFGVYTNVPALGKLLGTPPIFTALPMASAYAGVHASIAATFAYLHRLNTGTGQRLEVPLADAVLSAMAIHIMEVEDRPARFDMPPIDKVMTQVAFPIIRDLSDHLRADHSDAITAYLNRFRNPLVGNYTCADGRLLFVHATEHIAQTGNFLRAVGLLDWLISEGMVLASPYHPQGEGNNLCDSASLSVEWRQRIGAALQRKLAEKPAEEWEKLFRAAKAPATVVRTTQEWLSHQPNRDAGIVAHVGDPTAGASWQAGRFVSIAGAGTVSPPLAPARTAQAGIGWQGERTQVSPVTAHDGSRGILQGVRVLDLSNIIAGPAAGRVLAEFGALVTRIEMPSPIAGPRMTTWFGIDVNQGKRSVILDLKSEEGKRILRRLVETSDIVLHNLLDSSTANLGITHKDLTAIRPDIISCQVSAWGGPEDDPRKNDAAWDPVLQAATGITARYGTLENPVHHGSPSSVDFITGYSAALGIAQALVARRLGRGGSHVRTSLAMGAQLIQFPFMVQSGPENAEVEPSGQDALGYGAHYRLYEAADGWVFFACRRDELDHAAKALGARAATQEALREVFAASDLGSLRSALSGVGMASVVPVRSLERLRAERLAEEAVVARDEKGKSAQRITKILHPSGYVTAQFVPSWYRLEASPVSKLSPAKFPGADGMAVLQELGISDGDIENAYHTGVVRDAWPLLRGYLGDG